jgi:hypothetical protein
MKKFFTASQLARTPPVIQGKWVEEGRLNAN